MTDQSSANGSSGPPPSADLVSAVIAQARTRVAAGSLDEARRILEQGLTSVGDSPALHEQLGLILAQEGTFVAAFNQLSRAIELDPQAAGARLGLLRVAPHVVDRADVVTLAEEAVAAAPHDPKILALSARAFRRNGDFARAGDLWHQAALLMPNDTGLLIDAGEAYMRGRSFKNALDCAVEAIRRDKTAQAAMILRLQVLDRSHAEPIEVAGAIGQLASVNAAAAFDYLPTLIAQGLYAEVSNLIAACKRQGATVDPVVLASLGTPLLKVAVNAEAEQRFEAAAGLWQALLTIDPGDRRAAGGLRTALLSLSREARDAMRVGEYTEAAQRFQVLVALEDSNMQAWRELAAALEKSGEWAKAAEAWLRCGAGLSGEERVAATARAARAARKVDDPAVQLATAIAARQLSPEDADIRESGRRAAAKTAGAIVGLIEAEALEEASRLVALVADWDDQHPKLPSVRRKVVRALKVRMQTADRTGEVAPAARFARLLLGIEPAQVGALKRVAREALQDRRYGEAADLYSRLVALDPGDERHYAKLGRALKALRMYDQGIPIVMRLLEIHPDHPQGRQLLSEMLHGQQMQHA